jgi:N-acetylglutamate synthase-like GNAT family acetyltransferase
MKDVHIEVLNFQTPAPMALEAAKLLLSEEAAHKHEGKPVTEREITQYLVKGRAEDRVHYGAIKAARLVAAAQVTHRGKQGRERWTSVWTIAVEESERRDGIGSLLMKRIAERAAEAGDSQISVFSLEDAFFEKLGFVAIDPDSGDDEWLGASPADVLSA